jgi:hypothetical protein
MDGTQPRRLGTRMQLGSGVAEVSLHLTGNQQFLHT